MGNSTSNRLPALQTVPKCETARLMGIWFVIAVKPTMFETTSSNAVERYTLLNTNDKNTKKGSHDIDIDFQYNNGEPITSPLKSVPQKGWVKGQDKNNSGLWTISPMWPIKMPYLILEVDEEKYSYCVIGYPSRAYCWIMSRTPHMNEDTYSTLTRTLVEKHQYNLDGLRKVPQKWTAEERTKRGLSEDDIPDELLSK